MAEIANDFEKKDPAIFKAAGNYKLNPIEIAV